MVLFYYVAGFHHRLHCVSRAFAKNCRTNNGSQQSRARGKFGEIDISNKHSFIFWCWTLIIFVHLYFDTSSLIMRTCKVAMMFVSNVSLYLLLF